MFLGKDGIKHLSQQVSIGNDFSQGLKLLRIFGVGNPEFEVSTLAIFLSKVFYAAGKVLLACQFGVVGHAVLHCAADDGPGNNKPISLGHYTTIDCSWLVVRRCANLGTSYLYTLVLYGLLHSCYLLCCKVLPQKGVRGKNLSRDDMVAFSTLSKPRIVVCGNGVHHIYIYIVV